MYFKDLPAFNFTLRCYFGKGTENLKKRKKERKQNKLKSDEFVNIVLSHSTLHMSNLLLV